MCSFRGGHFGITRYLITKSTLPFVVNQNFNSYAEEKVPDIQKQQVRLK